jgi:hypothetical protein
MQGKVVFLSRFFIDIDDNWIHEISRFEEKILCAKI